MRLSILGFAFGIWWLQQQASLPELPALAALGGVAAALLFSAVFCRRLRAAVPVAALLLGIGWAAGMAQQRIADALPAANEGRDVRIIGVVSGLPQRFENGVRFDFSVEQADMEVPAHVSLAWYRGGWREAEEPMAP